jgi:hypothetical protein
LALLRNNHLSLPPIDFKVMMIWEDGRHGEHCNTVEEVERERSRWMRGLWAAVAVSDEITARSKARCSPPGCSIRERELAAEAKEQYQSIVLRFTSGRTCPITIIMFL